MTRRPRRRSRTNSAARCGHCTWRSPTSDGDLAPLSGIRDWLAGLIDELRPSPELTRQDIDWLRCRLEALTPTVFESALPAQALHGDASLSNLLRTPRGLVWNDLEDVCTGPVAWDVAGLVTSARHRGQDAKFVADFLAAYGDPGVDDFEQLPRGARAVRRRLAGLRGPAPAAGHEARGRHPGALARTPRRCLGGAAPRHRDPGQLRPGSTAATPRKRSHPADHPGMSKRARDQPDPVRVLRRAAFGFETIAVAAIALALVPVRSATETTGWTIYPTPRRGVDRIATLGLFDPALWLGAGVAMAVAGGVLFLLSRRIATPRR